MSLFLKDYFSEGTRGAKKILRFAREFKKHILLQRVATKLPNSSLYLYSFFLHVLFTFINFRRKSTKI